MLTRRFILAAAAATAAASSLPAGAAAPPPPSAPPMPCWIVGTDGDFNFQIVRAATREQAIRLLAEEESGLTACECREEPFGRCCDLCRYASRDAYRAEHFDTIAAPSAADWLRAGLAHTCSRCDYETFNDTGWAVGDEAICEECMTVEDFDVVDPARAAEMREEMADD